MYKEKLEWKKSDGLASGWTDIEKDLLVSSFNGSLEQ
jgi:hypothetical protein